MDDAALGREAGLGERILHLSFPPSPSEKVAFQGQTPATRQCLQELGPGDQPCPQGSVTRARPGAARARRGGRGRDGG